jgi:membrane-associated phospholipid phosphatase
MTMRFIKLRNTAAAGFIVLLGAVLPAWAQQVPAPLRFQVHRWPDAAILGGEAALTLVPMVFRNSLPHATCAPCNPANLWGIDRGSIGTFKSGPALGSDIALAGATLGGIGLLLTSRRGEPSAARVEDLVVFSEAMGLASAATAWAKVLVHRPRPLRYSSAALSYPAAGNGLSFPSGHTSQAFAAAAAVASILHRRGVLRRHRTEVVALFVAATATGVFRVAAHEHFPTDVIAGAALGTAIGWTAPRWHAVQ